MADQKTQGATLKKVLLRLKPYWAALIVSMVLATVSVLVSLYIPILVGRAIDHIISEGNVNFAAVGQNLLGVAICAGVSSFSREVFHCLCGT